MARLKSILVGLCGLSVLLLLSSCAAGIGGGISGQAGQGAENAGFKKGQGYFMRECSKCHRIFQPAERSVAAWPQILANKKNKVSLTATQFQQLSDYVMQESARVQAKP